MKKLVMILIAVATLQVSAQEQKKDMKKQRMESYKDYSPEDMAQVQTKRMTAKLDLNDKQQKEVSAIFLEDAKLRHNKREAFSKSDAKEARKNWSKEDRVKMTNERLDRQIEMKEKMKGVLSTDQFETWEKMIEERNNQYKNSSRSNRK